MNKSLKVILWGKEIGRLSWDDRHNISYFNASISHPNLELSPIIAPRQSNPTGLPIYGDNRRIYHKLPPFIADSLPDYWGSQLFDQWRTEHKIASSDITPLDKLAFIGSRGMSALEFVPEISHNVFATYPEQVQLPKPAPDGEINIESIIDLANKIFAQGDNNHILPEESRAFQTLVALGTLAGGRQPKIVISANLANGEICLSKNDSDKICLIKSNVGEIHVGEIPLGKGNYGEILSSQSVQNGFDYCILKFGDIERSTSELEMTYYQMARKAGIQMMESRLLNIGGTNHFLTRRFDRLGDKKLYAQTLAALYPDADSYESLIWVCRRLKVPDQDCEEVFRRMVFNVLANNTDDHIKNFSFVMDENGCWRLSPAYDLTFVFDNRGFLPQLSRCLMIRGKLQDITAYDIFNFANDNGISGAESIVREVVSAVSTFRQLALANNVKAEWIGRVESCLSANLRAMSIFLQSATANKANSAAPNKANSNMTESVASNDAEFAASNDAESAESVDANIDGHLVRDIHIEQAYQGNYHLLATIDGRQRKYVFRIKTMEYRTINEYGLNNVPSDLLIEMVKRYFF